MRLEFPNGEHEPVELKQSVTTLGSGARCTVRLSGAGIGVQHGRFECSSGQVCLHLRGGDAITALNGAWLHHDADLRGGDLLRFGPVVCQVVAGAAAQPRDADRVTTRLRTVLPGRVLRGLSGPVLGRSFAVRDGVICGRQHDCDICIESPDVSRRHACFHVTGKRVEVSDLESANGTFINGKRIRRAVLRPGDELALDVVRFTLIEPGANSAAGRVVVTRPQLFWLLAAAITALVLLAAVMAW